MRGVTLDDLKVESSAGDKVVDDWYRAEIQDAQHVAVRMVAPKIWEHATGAWNPSNSDRDRAEHLHSLRKLLAAASGNTWIKEAKA